MSSERKPMVSEVGHISTRKIRGFFEEMVIQGVVGEDQGLKYEITGPAGLTRPGTSRTTTNSRRWGVVDVHRTPPISLGEIGL